MDQFYQEHDRVPSRAWVLSRILVDGNGEPAYTEDEVRDLPLSEVEAVWQEFQGAMNAPPLPSPTSGGSSTD